MTPHAAWQANCCGAHGRLLGEEDEGGWSGFAAAMARANVQLFAARPEVKEQHEQAVARRAVAALGVVEAEGGPG